MTLSMVFKYLTVGAYFITVVHEIIFSHGFNVKKKYQLQFFNLKIKKYIIFKLNENIPYIVDCRV